MVKEFKILQKITQKAKEPVSASPLTIAFLGDSVTHGCFEIVEKSPGCFDCIYDHIAVYHQLLKGKIENAFPNCPINILNAGISGANASQCADRTARDVLAYHPDLAVICLGLNDAPAGSEGLSIFEESLSSIFTQFNEADTNALFMTPNMMCTSVLPELSAQ